MKNRDCSDPDHVPPLARSAGMYDHVHLGRCDHCGEVGIEHTPEDIRLFERDMLRIRLNREEFR